MKKALAIILSVMMLMSTLVACGSKTDDSGDANNDAAASYPTKNVNVIVPSAPAATPICPCARC